MPFLGLNDEMLHEFPEDLLPMVRPRLEILAIPQPVQPLSAASVDAWHRNLALQLPSVFQVRALCGGLMGAPPERPSNDMGRLDAPLRKPCDDAADFLRRPVDEG